MKRDIVYVSIVIVIGTLLRFLFSKPFPLDSDGFYYLRMARDHVPGTDLITWLGYLLGEHGILICLSIITIVNLILFYILCRQYMPEIYAFTSSIFFAISPLVFLNSYFGMADKNILSIFMILFILLVTKIFKERLLIQTILTTLLFLVFAFTWQGWVLLAFIYLIYYTYLCISNSNAKIRKFAYILVSIICILFISFGYGIFKYFALNFK